MKKLILILLCLCSTAYGGRYVFGTAACSDAWMRASTPYFDYNYGGSAFLYLNGSGIDNRGAVIRFADIWDSLSVDAGGSITVESCSLRVYLYSGEAEVPTVVAYRMFKIAFVEGTGTGQDVAGVTWNDWSSDDYEWTSAGCNSTDDGGSDNSGDASGADRKATAEGSVVINAGVGYYNIPITTALLQDRFDTDAPLCLYLTRGGTNQYPVLYSSESASPPTLIVNYSLSSPAANEDVKIGQVKLGSGVKLDN